LQALGGKATFVPYEIPRDKVYGGWVMMIIIIFGTSTLHFVAVTFMFAGLNKDAARADFHDNRGNAVDAATVTTSDLVLVAMEKVKFPNWSFVVVSFAYPGLCYESYSLVSRTDATAIDVVLGAIGTLLSALLLLAVQYWGTKAGRDAQLYEVSYRPYVHALEGVNGCVKLVFPKGYWVGSTRFMARFGALYDMFGNTHIRYITGIHFAKAVVVAIFTVIKANDTSGCRTLYLILAGFSSSTPYSSQ